MLSLDSAVMVGKKILYANTFRRIQIRSKKIMNAINEKLNLNDSDKSDEFWI